MPSYSFKCENDHEFTKIRKVEERDEPVNCPECEEPAERTIAAPSPAQFRGSGWTLKFY